MNKHWWYFIVIGLLVILHIPAVSYINGKIYLSPGSSSAVSLGTLLGGALESTMVGFVDKTGYPLVTNLIFVACLIVVGVVALTAGGCAQSAKVGWTQTSDPMPPSGPSDDPCCILAQEINNDNFNLDNECAQFCNDNCIDKWLECPGAIGAAHNKCIANNFICQACEDEEDCANNPCIDGFCGAITPT